jgi:hypothetical protein
MSLDFYFWILQDQLFVSLHSTQKYFLTSCKYQQQERYISENRDMHCDLSINLYFSNLSTYPDKYFSEKVGAA